MFRPLAKASSEVRGGHPEAFAHEIECVRLWGLPSHGMQGYTQSILAFTKNWPGIWDTPLSLMIYLGGRLID